MLGVLKYRLLSLGETLTSSLKSHSLNLAHLAIQSLAFKFLTNAFGIDCSYLALNVLTLIINII